MSKDEGGFGFRSFKTFNMALLAKQGWHLITNHDLLLAHVLKAKYYPSTEFLNSILKNGAFYTWKSIWAFKKVLNDGLCWRVRKGDRISIFNHAWLLGSLNLRLAHPVCD